MVANRPALLHSSLSAESIFRSGKRQIAFFNHGRKEGARDVCRLSIDFDYLSLLPPQNDLYFLRGAGKRFTGISSSPCGRKVCLCTCRSGLAGVVPEFALLEDFFSTYQWMGTTCLFRNP